MAIVAGVDFGTLSVRVSIIDSERGRLGTALGKYPLHRQRELRVRVAYIAAAAARRAGAAQQ